MGCVLLLGVGAIVWLSGASLASLGGGTRSKQGSGGPRVFTPEELQAEGSGASGKLMLAILGELHDVSVGTEFTPTVRGTTARRFLWAACARGA